MKLETAATIVHLMVGGRVVSMWQDPAAFSRALKDKEGCQIEGWLEVTTRMLRMPAACCMHIDR
jgi:hypothetical protein